MSDDSDFVYSEDEIDEKKHTKIVENVLKLNKIQQLKKPSRTEPTLNISEFNLVKSATGINGSIQLNTLAKVLKSRKKHAVISQKLDSTNKKAHTLPKPLEKPQAERIKRSVAYEKNRFLFDRWEAFVTSNRAQAHQVFPLDSVEKIKIEAKQAITLPQTWKFKSELQKEIEILDSPIEEYHINEESDKNDFPLSLQELKERRKEAAKLRAHQSFKEAKARRQNKIKSKKYHRILRKEKVKQKLKEFEELQKTNPEEALKKLNEIEKARALERYSLRHKGTGQWAKSKQIRAKYDKESRQVLAQQLQISRDLTQKLKCSDNESEDEFPESGDILKNGSTKEENPWINGIKPDQEVSEFLHSYKKFWTEQNNNPEQKMQYDSKYEELSDSLDNQQLNKDKNINFEPENQNEQINSNLKKKKIKSSGSCKKDISTKKKKLFTDQNHNKSQKKKKKLTPDASSGDWDIEDIFTNVEEKLSKRLRGVEQKDKKTTCKRQKIKVDHDKVDKQTKTKKINKKRIELSMPSQSKKHVIDEELIENPYKEAVESEKSKNIEKLANIFSGSSSNNCSSRTLNNNVLENIDPEKFMKPKVPTNLECAMPDIIVNDESSEENNQKHIIMEAFEDDDIVKDFSKEKKEELDKDKPQNIDLNLPGWGSWAGTGIKPKKERRRRRFIVKMPEVLPRRDDNKGSLIINEKATAKIKPHLVTEVPFPFKTVKDYEASIRAPIGNTFVPEIAFKTFIRPAVETKMGTIIEPVTVGTLMGKRRN